MKAVLADETMSSWYGCNHRPVTRKVGDDDPWKPLFNIPVRMHQRKAVGLPRMEIGRWLFGRSELSRQEEG
jgi:hypothetical protein